MGDDENDDLVQRIREDYENAREKRLLPIPPRFIERKGDYGNCEYRTRKTDRMLKHALREAQMMGEICTKKKQNNGYEKRKDEGSRDITSSLLQYLGICSTVGPGKG